VLIGGVVGGACKKREEVVRGPVPVKRAAAEGAGGGGPLSLALPPHGGERGSDTLDLSSILALSHSSSSC